MRVIHPLKMDLVGPWGGNLLHMVQGDSNTRVVELQLFSSEEEWEPPVVEFVTVAFKKPDQTKGFYETGCDIHGNRVQVVLAPQVLTAHGKVTVVVELHDAEGDSLASFPFGIMVDQNPGVNAVESEDYFDYVHPLITEAVKEANLAAAEAYAAAEKANSASEVAYRAERKVDTLREVVSKLHNNIVETATGEVIQLSDASDLELVGLNIDGTGTPETVTVTIAGKNLFPLEPFNPHTSNGITVSYEGCGIRLSGALENAASTGYIKQWLDYAYIYPPGTYTLSFSALCQPQIVVRFLNASGNSQLASIQNVSEMKKTITLNEPFTVGWAVYRNAKYDENKPTEPVRIQLERGEMMSEWEQYKKIQTFTADTPINLTETDLHTNYSNTTIFNDAGADMEVKYVADTKLYVDNKFAELAKALVSNT